MATPYLDVGGSSSSDEDESYAKIDIAVTNIHVRSVIDKSPHLLFHELLREVRLIDGWDTTMLGRYLIKLGDGKRLLYGEEDLVLPDMYEFNMLVNLNQFENERKASYPTEGWRNELVFLPRYYGLKVENDGQVCTFFNNGNITTDPQSVEILTSGGDSQFFLIPDLMPGEVYKIDADAIDSVHLRFVLPPEQLDFVELGYASATEVFADGEKVKCSPCNRFIEKEEQICFLQHECQEAFRFSLDCENQIAALVKKYKGDNFDLSAKKKICEQHVSELRGKWQRWHQAVPACLILSQQKENEMCGWAARCATYQYNYLWDVLAVEYNQDAMGAAQQASLDLLKAKKEKAALKVATGAPVEDKLPANVEAIHSDDELDEKKALAATANPKVAGLHVEADDPQANGFRQQIVDRVRNASWQDLRDLVKEALFKEDNGSGNKDDEDNDKEDNEDEEADAAAKPTFEVLETNDIGDRKIQLGNAAGLWLQLYFPGAGPQPKVQITDNEHVCNVPSTATVLNIFTKKADEKPIEEFQLDRNSDEDDKEDDKDDNKLFFEENGILRADLSRNKRIMDQIRNSGYNLKVLKKEPFWFQLGVKHFLKLIAKREDDIIYFEGEVQTKQEKQDDAPFPCLLIKNNKPPIQLDHDCLKKIIVMGPETPEEFDDGDRLYILIHDDPPLSDDHPLKDIKDYDEILEIGGKLVHTRQEAEELLEQIANPKNRVKPSYISLV